MNSIVYKADPEPWARFCHDVEGVPFFYCPSWQTYRTAYSRFMVEDLSFTVCHENSPIAIVPLLLENVSGESQISDANGFMRAPVFRGDLGAHLLKKARNYVMAEIDRLAHEKQARLCMLCIDPARQKIAGDTCNWLMQYGYLDTSLNTQMIDLRPALPLLHQNLRKRYVSLINKAKRTYRFVLHDYSNPDFHAHECYRELHHKAAGRVTRPLSTFNTQFEMLKTDCAMLLGAMHEGQWIAFNYFHHHGGTAYYASASDDFDANAIPCPVSHALMWAAIEYYKQRNFAFFETGLQQYSTQWCDAPLKKDIDISWYKSGFGGETVPFYRGVKYYSPDRLAADLKAAMERCESAYFEERPVQNE